VVLSFHGGGGNAAIQQSATGMDALADQQGFIVVYPNGTGPLEGRLLTWNAGACCGYAMKKGVDDVGFSLALLEDLAAKTPIDPSRIYATGFSNGAMLAHRLGAEAADRIAAIAPVAGALMLESISPARPLPLMHIHSVDDPRALYQGGLGPPFPLTNYRVLHPPVEERLALWLEANGCPAVPRIEAELRGGPGTPDAGHSATKLVYGPCHLGAEVVLWKLSGPGHVWPGGASMGQEAVVGPPTTIIDANREIWAFFQRFTRAGGR
jgi:polyhydroxybutyrate depolymerase